MTLDDIKARCTEDGDCWRWDGPVGTNKHPRIASRSARQIVYRMAHGAVPRGRVISVNCECIDCLNPEHLEATTKSKAAAKAFEKRPDIVRARAKKTADWFRANRAKLSSEDATQIRHSSEPACVVAQRFGVCRQTVVQIKSGKFWKDYSNPFAALLRTP